MMNKTIGATFIIAGTSIGASTLALPIVCYSLGIANSFLLMLFTCLLCYASSVLSIKVNMHYKGAYSVAQLCKMSFKNKFPKILADTAIITLFYSLLSAYISSIGDIFNQEFFKQSLGLIITAVLILLIITGVKAVDIANRLIFVIKILIFLTLLYILAKHSQFSNIYTSHNISREHLLVAIPVLFTSFGFHGSIPFVIRYLNLDFAKANKAFIYGITISMLLYISWITFVICTLPQYGIDSSEKSNHSVHYFINALSNIVNIKSFTFIAKGFTQLAIITSFFGVGSALYDYFSEKIKVRKKNKPILTAITFFPPLMISLFYKNIFIKALGFAAISLAIIAIILPSIIALKKIKLTFPEKIIIYLTLASGLIIILAEFLN